MHVDLASRQQMRFSCTKMTRLEDRDLNLRIQRFKLHIQELCFRKSSP